MINRLDNKDKKKIVELAEQGIIQRYIAERFGVSQGKISMTIKEYSHQAGTVKEKN